MSLSENSGFDMMKYVGIIAKFAEKYSTYDDTTRCVLLLDKLQILMTGGMVAAAATYDNDIKRISDNADYSDEKKIQLIAEVNTLVEATEKSFEIVMKEINFMEGVIREKKDTPLQNIERKLDEVLLGPYYSAGKELMASAYNDFTNHANEKPIKKKKQKRSHTISVSP